jgi:predicted acyltransferase
MATAKGEVPAGGSGDSSGDRVLSVDALRGFDMFWIIGAAGVVKALHAMGDNAVLNFFATQLGHKDWAGFAFEDLIFPLFVFLVGISLVFSLGRLIAREGRFAAHERLFRRFVLLFLLGLFYYGGFSNPWPEIRLLGVLQRLALCYLFAGLLFCHLKPRGLIIVFLALLVGYWAWLTFVPVPGLGRASFAKGENWACYIDRLYLPGRKHYDTWDPEGILSTLPAIASCLLGVFAGLILTNPAYGSKHRMLYFFGGGIALVLLGTLWGLQFPVIKKIWTSSYVLLAGGYSCLLLGAFYLVMDVWKFRLWARPFLWIGSNALTIYLAVNIVEAPKLAERFVGGDIHTRCGPYGDLLVTAVSLGLVLLLARFLYRRQIFLRV